MAKYLQGEDAMHIAVLEDNPTILDLLKATLAIVGHTTMSYTEGSSFLDALFESHTPSEHGHTPFDMLIIDLYLPGDLSGLQVIERVQERIAPEKLPPIILISGAGQEKLAQIQRDLPMIVVLRKPFKMKDFYQVVEQAQGKVLSSTHHDDTSKHE
jgi:CheY-like chemotaxis protein